MPKAQYKVWLDRWDRKVFTTWRVDRLTTGYQCFKDEKEARAYYEEHGARLVKVVQTIVLDKGPEAVGR